MCESCCPKNPPRPFSSGCSCWHSSPPDVLCFMQISILMEHLTRCFRLAQQLFKLIVANRQHFHRSSLRGAGRSSAAPFVEEFHLSEVLSGPELHGNYVRLVATWQNDFHGALGHDI